MGIVFYYSLIAHPIRYPGINDDGAYILVASLHMMPLSCGTMKQKSGSSKDYPVCDLNFFSTETDRSIMRSPVSGNLRLVELKSLADEKEGEVTTAAFLILSLQSSDKEIAERVRAFGMTVAHLMGCQRILRACGSYAELYRLCFR